MKQGIFLVAVLIAGCQSTFQPDFPVSQLPSGQPPLSSASFFTAGYTSGAHYYSMHDEEVVIEKDYIHDDQVEIDVNGDGYTNIIIRSVEDTIVDEGASRRVRYLSISGDVGTELSFVADHDGNVLFHQRGMTVSTDFPWTDVENLFYINYQEVDLGTGEVVEYNPVYNQDYRYFIFRTEQYGRRFEGWIELVPHEYDNFSWKNFASFSRN